MAVKDTQGDPKPTPDLKPGPGGDGGDGGTPDPAQAAGAGTGGGGGDPAGPDGGDKGGKGASSGNSVKDLPDWAQKEIKDLRTENASNRTKTKSLEERMGKFEKGFKAAFGEEDEGLTDEQRLDRLETQNQGAEFRNAMLEMCLDHGITDPVDRKFLSHLITEAGEELNDGEELPEETLTKIIEDVKKRSGGKPASSSADDGGDPPPPETKSDITLDQFVAMNMQDKNQLFRDKPEIYNALWKETKSKGLV